MGYSEFGTDSFKLFAKAHDRLESELAKDAKLLSSLLESRSVWRLHNWDRYFHVPGGSLHSHTKCSTLSDRTKWVWLVELSAESLDHVVALGYRLCKRCFPSAISNRVRHESCKGSGMRTLRGAACAGEKVACPHCNRMVMITSAGVLRRHR